MLGRPLGPSLLMALVFSLFIANVPQLYGAEVVILATHEAKFNLDGSVLGTYREYTPLRVKDVPPGQHKLYAKSSLTSELLIFKFDVPKPAEQQPAEQQPAEQQPAGQQPADQQPATQQPAGQDILLRADFREPRKATLSIPGSGIGDEASIASAEEKQSETKISSPQLGNTLEIKSAHPIEVNLDGKAKKQFTAKEAKLLHKLSPGKHKVYLRSMTTKELEVYDIEFAADDCKTLLLTPTFTDSKEPLKLALRRKIGTRAVEVARQLFGSPPPKEERPLSPAINTEVVLSLSKLPIVTAKESHVGGQGMTPISKLHVLVVDDERDVRSVIQALLEDRGFTAEAACCAEEAISILGKKEFDAVLLDVHMPGLNGDQVLAYIRRTEATKHMPVIVISASRDAEYELIDVFDYLPKPVDFDRLFSHLDYIAARKRVEGEVGSHTLGTIETISTGEFESLQQVLMKRSGLNIPLRRRTELGRAVWSRVRALLKPNLDSYRRLIDSDAGEPELKKLVLLLTVGETYFFRNRSHFNALDKHVLPRLKERLMNVGRRTVRVLSAGGSTGEEAYSLAIVLREFFPVVTGWDVKVLAIDINNRSLCLARRGYYKGASFRSLDAGIKAQHFTEQDGRWRVRSYLRDMVDFRYYNLRDLANDKLPAWLRNVDLVFCRNVLIYFDRDTIEGVVHSFAEMIPEGGFLFLGHSESGLQTSLEFDIVYKENVFFYERNGKSRPSDEAEAPICPQALLRDIQKSQDAHDSVPDFDFLFQRGLALFDKEDFYEANKVFDRILKLDSENAKAHVGRGFILANQGQEETAMELVEKALHLDVGLAEAYFLRAMLLERSAKIEQAFDDYQRAVLWSPDFVMARINLGFAAERLGKQDFSKRVFSEAYDLLKGKTAYKPDVKLSGGMNFAALEALAKGKAG